MNYKNMNAIGIVRLMLTDGTITEEQAAKYFPELTKSEDEIIREEIIDFLRLPHLQFIGKRDHERWIAWLEKQGKPTDILADAVLDNNEDGLIADTIRHKKELVTCPICGSKIEKQSEYKSAFWSEEDEERYLSCLKRLGTGNIEQPETINTVWLKALKDRIQPQQEWSEEDEINRDLLYNALNKVYDIDHNVDLSNWINKRILLCSKQEWSEEDKMQLDAAIHLVSSTGHIETANWLKSIKNRVPPQSTWKPSDEQFKLLKHIMENVPLAYRDKSEVGELYLDLKKLKG